MFSLGVAWIMVIPCSIPSVSSEPSRLQFMVLGIVVFVKVIHYKKNTGSTEDGF